MTEEHQNCASYPRAPVDSPENLKHNFCSRIEVFLYYLSFETDTGEKFGEVNLVGYKFL